MPSSILNSDDGVISGTSGLKSSGGDDGTLAVQSNGTEIAKFKTTELVINDGGANYDFRVEGDTNANLLVVDASADAIGIGTNAPATLVDIAANNTGLTSTTANNTVRFTDTDTTSATNQPLGKIEWYSADITTSARVGAYILATSQGTSGGGNLEFGTATNTGNVTEQMQITGAGDLQFNSGYGSVATAYGCRAWVNFDGTGTPAIRASGNVSSITDEGTGRYQINFSTSMPDVNFAAFVSGNATTDSYSSSRQFNMIKTRATGSVDVEFIDDGGGNADPSYVGVGVFR